MIGTNGFGGDNGETVEFPCRTMRAMSAISLSPVSHGERIRGVPKWRPICPANLVK